ncbi:hypothetical protein VTI74DRAFT_11416 [Chaetomium olivicolor]
MGPPGPRLVLIMTGSLPLAAVDAIGPRRQRTHFPPPHHYQLSNGISHPAVGFPYSSAPPMPMSALTEWAPGCPGYPPHPQRPAFVASLGDIPHDHSPGLLMMSTLTRNWIGFLGVPFAWSSRVSSGLPGFQIPITAR